MLLRLLSEIKEFVVLWCGFVSGRLRWGFFGFETYKKAIAELLYRQRGKFARPFVHSGMVALSAMGVMLAPVISEEFPKGGTFLEVPSVPAVLSAATENPAIATTESDKVRDKIYEYSIQEGDTISSIAEKFGVSQDTIVWENNLPKKDPVLKPGQVLKILPVVGVSHKVLKGETIYSIAKKYSAEPQAIVDFPFNTFVNDETFALAVGQTLIIPDGTPPKEVAAPSRFARITPDAGTVTAFGDFVWPASGNISQGFAFYHKGIDVASKLGPDILAADAGSVIVATCTGGGYGCHVIVDHDNGFTTLYAHLSKIYVTQGQTIGRGGGLGRMGSTGRSTGTHLHFEIRKNGVQINPLSLLR